MRSCLHRLLVGVLAFSLSIDVARACGHLRRWRHCAPACATMPVAPGPCGVPACDCGMPALVGVCGGCEEIACGTPLDCGATTVAAAPGTAEPEANDAGHATESVVAPAVPPAAPGAPEPIAAVPDLEPVETVSATETEPEMPAEEPAVPETDGAPTGEPGVRDVPMEEPPAAGEPPADETMPEEQPVAEPQPAPAPQPAVEPAPAPPPRNVFEEEAGEGNGDEPQSLDEPAITEEPAVVPVDEPAMEQEPSPPPVDDVIPSDAPPADESPVGPPPSEPGAEPAAEPQPVPESGAAAEPLRRWIDHTASHAVAGRLVAVQGERVEIVRADGRTVVVPLARLSGFDREYVAEAAARLAPAGPRATDTARATH